MNTALFGRPLWRPNPWRGGALNHRRPMGLAVLARAFGVAGIAVALGAVAALSLPGSPQAETGPSGGIAKDESRLPGGSEPQATPQVLIAPEPPAPALRAAALPPDPFSPDLMAAPGALTAPVAFVPDAVMRRTLAAWTAVPPRIGVGWREEEFIGVAVVDGRTLLAGQQRIRLAGLDLPDPEQVCPALDGTPEPCWLRAMTQLELLTRWRRVVCRYRPDGEGEALGHCRVGSSDLARRMILTGYAWQVS